MSVARERWWVWFKLAWPQSDSAPHLHDIALAQRGGGSAFMSVARERLGRALRSLSTARSARRRQWQRVACVGPATSLAVLRGAFRNFLLKLAFL